MALIVVSNMINNISSFDCWYLHIVVTNNIGLGFVDLDREVGPKT